MIAIYREATSTSKSTKSHLFLKQDYSNRTALSQNFARDNILLTFKDGKINNKILFNRTETTANKDVAPKKDLNLDTFKRVQKNELLEIYESLENQHYQHIKHFYESKKKQKKLENPTQKIQTVYKTKNDQVHKEFLVAFGSDLDKSFLDSKDFYNKSIKAVKSQLEKMGLSDRNLVSITFHRDEGTFQGSVHLHVRYTNFDFDNCQSLNSTHAETAKKLKQSIPVFRKNLLSELQKEINKSYDFKFEPRKKDPTRKHKTKREWLIEENERLEAKLKENIQKSEQKYSINFENLVKTNKFEDCKKTIETLEKAGVSAGNGKNLLDEFLQFLTFFLGRKKDIFIKENISFGELIKTTKEIKKETILF